MGLVDVTTPAKTSSTRTEAGFKIVSSKVVKPKVLGLIWIPKSAKTINFS